MLLKEDETSFEQQGYPRDLGQTPGGTQGFKKSPLVGGSGPGTGNSTGCSVAEKKILAPCLQFIL